VKKSIYRGWRDLPSDVQLADMTVTGGPGWSHAESKPDLTRLRRGDPVNRLLPRSVDWILGLPPAVRPHVLASKYARIVNQLCVSWNDPAAVRKYLAELLTDRRGGRQGFPMGIVKELHALRKYHKRLHPEHEDPWQDG
jgi:hypothetical protein